MATRTNGPLRFCLAGAAIGGLVAFAPVPLARAQWLPPWGGVSPGEIERSLEAQGYGLIAPLVRRPGVYLADVSAGPAGYQRLIVDARSGQILERFSPWSNVGICARRARRKVWRAAPRRRNCRGALASSASQQRRRRRTNLTAGQRASIFQAPLVHMAPRMRRPERSPSRNRFPPTARRRRPGPRQRRLCRLPRHAMRRRRTDQARQRPSRRRRMIGISRKSRSTTPREPQRRRRQVPPLSRPTDRR